MESLIIIWFTLSTLILIIHSIFIIANTSKDKGSDSSDRKSAGISVIMASRNEQGNLNNFLPIILGQKYENFEVIVIDDRSSDDSLQLLSGFKNKYRNLKIIEIEKSENGGKKNALQVGIAAAKNELLVFTDADCYPLSENWLSSLYSHFQKGADVILGYGGYEVCPGFLNKLIRFDTLTVAGQYYSMANYGSPYMGVGRNMAYKKTVFNAAGGFKAHLNVASGDDDLFIQGLKASVNVHCNNNPNSFVKSIPKTTLRAWMNQKTRHLSTSFRYSFSHKIILAMIPFSIFGFWFTFITMSILYDLNWQLMLLFIIRIVFLILCTRFLTKHFEEKELSSFSPLLELILLVVNSAVLLIYKISPQTQWK